MTTTIAPLELCLQISQAHASLRLRLDDDLGTFHGLAFSDFILLHLLAQRPGGCMAIADLVRPMGVPLSAVTRQLVLLEKTGWLQRESAAADDARRLVVLRPAGRRLVNEARATAEAVCNDAVGDLAPDSQVGLGVALSTLSESAALQA